MRSEKPTVSCNFCTRLPICSIGCIDQSNKLFLIKLHFHNRRIFTRQNDMKCVCVCSFERLFSIFVPLFSASSPKIVIVSSCNYDKRSYFDFTTLIESENEKLHGSLFNKNGNTYKILQVEQRHNKPLMYNCFVG